jgi:hypothetical protein
VDCPETTQLSDLLAGNFMHSCTVVYRRYGPFGFPEWFASQALGDWPMHVLQARMGDILFVNAPLAVYRLHRGGGWSNRPFAQRRDEAIRTLALLKDELLGPDRTRIDDTIRRMSAMIDDSDEFGLGAA